MEKPLWQTPYGVSALATVNPRPKKERGASPGHEIPNPGHALQALQSMQVVILMDPTSRLQKVPGPRPLPRFEHAIMQGNVLQCSALLSLYALLSLCCRSILSLYSAAPSPNAC